MPTKKCYLRERIITTSGLYFCLVFPSRLLLLYEPILFSPLSPAFRSLLVFDFLFHFNQVNFRGLITIVDSDMCLRFTPECCPGFQIKVLRLSVRCYQRYPCIG